MLAIRFQRTGRTNDASFRIVVSEKQKHPKAGSPLQVVGSYNPKTKHSTLDADSIKNWIAKGAQPSGTVHNLLISKGIVSAKKVNVRLTKVVKKEAKNEEREGKIEIKVEAATAIAKAPAQ